jgi:hypothetical protein
MSLIDIGAGSGGGLTVGDEEVGDMVDNSGGGCRCWLVCSQQM